jgi:hypothetical protein
MFTFATPLFTYEVGPGMKKSVGSGIPNKKSQICNTGFTVQLSLFMFEIVAFCNALQYNG